MSQGRKKQQILSGSLSDLIAKFSEHDVIGKMEKEYQSAPARLIPITLIDDSKVLSTVAIPKKTVEIFAAGLREKGFYNPLVVCSTNNRFEVVLGRKRFFGAKHAGILSIPCVVLDIQEEEKLLMLLADARDQKEINVLEMALVCKALEEEFDYPQKTLAELSHQSRSQITNILRVLKLPQSLQRELAMGKLSYGHAKAIASLSEGEMVEVGEYVLTKHLSVHQLEDYLRLRHQSSDANDAKIPSNLKGRVSVSGKQISISTSSEDEKSKILSLLSSFYE